MFRTMLVAAAAVTIALPAAAQDVGALEGDPWECRSTSLIGDPPSNIVLAFGDDDDLMVSFFMEMPVDNGTVGVEFDLAGEWWLEGSTIQMEASDFTMIGAWFNGEAMSDEDTDAIADGLETEFSDFSAESDIAYVAAHALVLDEPETSISCWR